MKFPPFIFLSSKVAIFRFHRPILEAYDSRSLYVSTHCVLAYFSVASERNDQYKHTDTGKQ